MRSLNLLLIALALAAMPFAHAQVPGAPTPTYTVEIMNAPAAFTGLEAANAASTAPFQVVLTISNVVCAAAVTIPVAITAEVSGAPSNFAVVVEPAVINITVSEGPHGSPPVGSPGGGTGDAVARATITGNITANASAQVTLTAAAPAPPAPPTGCQGAGGIAAATSAPVVVFANMTAPPPPPEPTPVEEDTPGFGVAALAAAAVGAALLARRKRA